MAYIGNKLADAYTSFAKQDFTTSATTSYTLDNPVTNANEIALFINFVRQEPTTAYTATGTSLTLTSATSASDDMYCVFLGKAVQTVNPPAGSVGISQLSATGTKDSTTFLRGDNTFASAGGANTPAFEAYLSADQTFSSASWTKIQFNTESFDTDSMYDNSTNYRFTPTTAGKYFFYISVKHNASGSNDMLNTYLALYKNGSSAAEWVADCANGINAITIGGGKIIDLNGSTDYVEGYVYQNTSNTPTIESGITGRFGGYKIIE